LETEKIKSAAERMKDNKNLPPESELGKAVEQAKATNEGAEASRQAEQRSGKR
jgi:hypothetical protein